MKRKIALGLAATTLLTLGGGGYAYAYAKNPVAYVSVDINPSIELGVNAFDKVVSVEAYNEDGEKILEGTALINLDIDDAVSTVISNAISDGYIKEDDTITTDEVDTTATTSTSAINTTETTSAIDTTTTTAAAVEITTSTDKEDVAEELNECLKEVADETLDNNNIDAEVETENVALARRDEARSLGITPGKLNLIQKLQALDSAIKVEDYKTSSVKDIQKKVKELRKSKNADEITTNSNNYIDTDSETNTDSNVNTDLNAYTDTDNTNTNTDTNTNTNQETTVATEDETKEAALSEEPVESEESEENAVIESNKNNKSSHEYKNNNGIDKKEDNKEKNNNKNVSLKNNGNSNEHSNGKGNGRNN